MKKKQVTQQNLILSDCIAEEIFEFKTGLERSMGIIFQVKAVVSNWGRGLWNNIRRYFLYMFSPLKIFFKRKKYNYIVGWQQFYALFFCWYCKLFHVKKKNIVCAGNFTYKKKNGLRGRIYLAFMKGVLTSKYLDYIHVPSEEYGKICRETFGLSEEKIIVAHFGIPDIYDAYKNTKIEQEPFALAIGRSNRDFDWLVSQWIDMPLKLVIISDVFKPQKQNLKNIILLDNISGEKQYPYIINCAFLIIPILDGTICSGDTVLLTGMSFEKCVIITKPSTLAEMYITDGTDGICVRKDEDFKKIILGIDAEKSKQIGKNARLSYKKKYSRENMGIAFGKHFNEYA